MPRGFFIFVWLSQWSLNSSKEFVGTACWIYKGLGFNIVMYLWQGYSHLSLHTCVVCAITWVSGNNSLVCTSFPSIGALTSLKDACAMIRISLEDAPRLKAYLIYIKATSWLIPWCNVIINTDPKCLGNLQPW